MAGTAGLTEAQDAALRGLVERGALTAGQADEVREALVSAAPRRGATGWLVEIAGYVGGGLMLGGVAVFLGASWDALSRAGRAGALAGFAVAFAVAGVVVAGGPAALRRLSTGTAGVRRRIVAVLLALAAVPAAFAAAVTTDRYAGLAGAGTGLVVALAGLVLLPAVPGVLVTAVLSGVAVFILDEELLHPSTTTGTSLRVLGLGLVWTVVALRGLVSPRWLGLAVGAGYAILGAQQPLDREATRPLAYGLTLAVGLACFALYRWAREPVTLVAGVVAVTLAVPEAVADVTDGALGGAAVLLVAGAVLVAASAVGLRMRRDAAHRSGPPAPTGPGPTA